MKLLFQDVKKGEVKIQITSLDDLWFLSHIIDEGDLVSGQTIRKIKLGEAPDKEGSIVKKPVWLAISVEKIDFHKYSNSLRVSGKIVEGPEDVPRGSYHTFDVHVDTVITVQKKQWLKYQSDKLREACEEKAGNVLILTLDRESACYARLTASGYSILLELEGEVGKKGYAEVKGKEFFADVVKQLADYVQRHSIQSVILASPAFWKEDVLAIIKKNTPQIASLITLATCNTVGKTGIEEVLKRDEVKQVLRQDRTTRESVLVEELFTEIAKQGAAAYGWKEVKDAVELKAVKLLLVTDELIHERRAEGKYGELDTMMKEVDRTNGDVHIISTDHDAGKKLQGLGGIGAILRYKLQY